MRILRQRLLMFWAIDTLLLLGLMIGSSPERVGPGGVVALFILIYIWILLTVLLINKFIFRNRDVDIANSREFAIVSFISLVPTLALALQSLDQLVWRDVFILISLVGISIFYWTRRG